MFSVLRSQPSGSVCNPSKLLIRRAWGDMSEAERLDYTHATLCMYTQPSRTDPAAAPGSRNRVDDFVYQHINQTNFIHQDGLLLPWHRHYIWSWEKDLREVCGYKGALPSWAWERHANLSASPVFQAGQDSFGGDRAYAPYNSTLVIPVGLPPGINITQLSFTRPVGNGGGCVTKGREQLGAVHPTAVLRLVIVCR